MAAVAEMDAFMGHSDTATQTCELPNKYAGFREKREGKRWSGKRGSNPRHPAWEAGTLPTELFPLRVDVILALGTRGVKRRRLSDLSSVYFTTVMAMPS